MITLNETERAITEDALNHFWHWVITKLKEDNLGDIQRKNLELDKKRLDDLLARFR
jgi:hypothetical protein